MDTASITTPASTANSSPPTALAKAWKERFPELSDDERQRFEALTCNGLDAYLQTLKAACEEHAEQNVVNRALDWFGPIFRAVELFQPIIGVVAGAHPGGNLALGGVMSILQTTKGFEQYQSCTLQMLARMGRKASVISEYGADLYKDNDQLQVLLVQVIGDILTFCYKSCRIIDAKGGLKAKIRGLKLVIFRDFQSQLGKEVEVFEGHMEQLDSLAAVCDKKRLKKILDNLESQRESFDKAQTATRQLIEQQAVRVKDDMAKLARRIVERVYRISRNRTVLTFHR